MGGGSRLTPWDVIYSATAAVTYVPPRPGVAVHVPVGEPDPFPHSSPVPNFAINPLVIAIFFYARKPYPE